jgi:hypothetical protein
MSILSTPPLNGRSMPLNDTYSTISVPIYLLYIRFDLNKYMRDITVGDVL